MLKIVRTVSSLLLTAALCSGGTAYAVGAMAAPAANVTQQSNSVKGTVSDAFGPVTGASVVVKGTTNGITTDLDGNFVLSDLKSGDIIVVSFIGYVTQEIKYTGQATLAVNLVEDSQALEEVVVVGYGVQKKVNMTGSVAQVDAKALEARPITNVSAGLQGMMPGVTITSGEGRPGSGNTIRVRGVGTLNSSNPYILVDGIETGTLDSVDPNDIESISVLKDAASAAIYGSKAANGVILITTKRGKSGKPSISYNGYVSLSNPTKTRDLMNSYNYARLYDEALVREGKDPRWGTEALEKFKDHSDPYNYPDTDWYDEALQTGMMHSHNVNVNGGTDDMKYMASVGYLGQTGLLPNSERKQFNGRTNLDVKVNNWLNVRVNMAYINNEWKDPNSSYAGGSSWSILKLLTRMAPWIVGRYPDGTYGTVSDGSPLAWLDADQTVDNKNQNFSGTLSADIKLMDGLVATVTGSHVNNNRYKRAWQKEIQYNPNKKSEKNKLTEERNGWTRNNLDVLLNYDKQFGLHGLKAMAGWHAEKYDYSFTKAERKGFANNDLNDMDAGDSSTMKNEGYRRELAMLSWFARVNYDFAGKYLFEANIRADASSRFAEGHRWGYFPSFSAAWRISEEAFMEDTRDWLSSLKLRGSYGNLGNQDALASYYPWMSTYAIDSSYPFGDALQVGYYQKAYNVSTISWEKTRTWGVGFDATLIDKINVSFDYYDRKTTDIIMKVPVSPEFGLGDYVDNKGAMQNRGMELSVGYNDKWGDWTFGATANVAYNKNELLDLGGALGEVDPNDGSKYRAIGHAINSYRVYVADGLFRTQAEADEYEAKYNKPDTGYPWSGRTMKAGDIRYKDVNGDGKINEDDKAWAGSTDPSWTFGLSLNAGWKNFDLSMVFTGVADVKRCLDWAGYGGKFEGDDSRPDNIWLDAWSETNKNGKMPRIAINGASNNFEQSTFWLEDGSYIRLKNLQFGYTLPKNFLQRLGVDKVRFYYSGENLLTFDKMMIDIDPEIGSIYGFPTNRTHAFGVNVTF